MRFLLSIAAVTLLSGCAQLYGFAAAQLPSLEYCDSVTYVRKGVDVTIQANCRAPVR